VGQKGVASTAHLSFGDAGRYSFSSRVVVYLQRSPVDARSLSRPGLPARRRRPGARAAGYPPPSGRWLRAFRCEGITPPSRHLLPNPSPPSGFAKARTINDGGNKQCPFKTNNSATIGSDFGELYVRYGERLLAGMTKVVKNREKAEDIAAKAFRIAFEQRERFRGESSFYTWLFTIALNEARRMRPSRDNVSLEEISEWAPAATMVSDATAESLDKSEDCERLNAALDCLPWRYRAPLIAHFVQGQSTKQIARQLSIPLGTVLSRIFKGKALLRAAWREVG
jgi:RNA polymerase sigma-70 factor, ECF subfamily